MTKLSVLFKTALRELDYKGKILYNFVFVLNFFKPVHFFSNQLKKKKILINCSKKGLFFFGGGVVKKHSGRRSNLEGLRNLDITMDLH